MVLVEGTGGDAPLARGNSGVHQFSTDDFPDRDKASVWREHFGDAIAKMDMTVLGDEPFRCVSQIRTLPDLTIWSCAITESEVRRTRAHVADGDDSLVLAIMRKGRSAVTQAGREAVFGNGDALLWATDKSGVYRNLSAVELLCLKLPRRGLMSTVTRLDTMMMTTIPASSEALRLLTSYVRVLNDDPAPLTPELQALSAAHIHDLVSLALGVAREASVIARSRGLRAARLYRVKTDIIANLGKAEVNVDDLAVRHGISPRYIRTLFDDDGTTFSDFLREQRLRRARRLLSDPASAERNIGRIAHDCGFSSVPYFNQAFRRRYGMTPSDVRAATKSSS